MKKNIAYAAIPSPITCLYKTSTLSNSGLLHAHNGYEIICYLAGNVDLYYESDSIRMQSGDIVLIPPYVFHWGYQNNEAAYIRDILNIREDYTFKGRENDFDKLRCIFQAEDSRKIKVTHPDISTFNSIHHLMVLLSKTINKPAGFDNLLLRDTYVAQIMISIFHAQEQQNKAAPSVVTENSNEMPEIMTNAFQYIANHLTEDICLEAIANHIHISKYYLCRTFHEYTGGSIGQYIIDKRLALAMQSMRDGKRPGEACFSSGFSNYANFSRTFSHHVGLSPKTYYMTVHSKIQTEPYNG